MDAGPAILASLIAESQPDVRDEAAVVVVRWLSGLQSAAEVGLFGGIAGYAAGTQAALDWYPPIRQIASQLLDSLTTAETAEFWRTQPLAWRDYDLPSGPAGLILAAASAGNLAVPIRAIRHLVSLCAADNLEGLRVNTHRTHELIGWNYGRINTGLAHGVGAIVAALRSALNYKIAQLPDDATNVEDSEIRLALRRACNWLVAESFEDDRGLLTWVPAGREGEEPPRAPASRQGWCYGTPGLAWTLWDAGLALGDQSLQAFAAEAMCRFCAIFEEDFYIDREGIDDALGICHGAAGMLAIADAFVLHAELDQAEVLRHRLHAYLIDHLKDVRELAGSNPSLLTGAGGILSVLMTLEGGRRDWLQQIALR